MGPRRPGAGSADRGSVAPPWSWRLPVAALLLVASVGAAGTAVAPGGRAVVVEDAATGEVLLARPAGNGTTVALEYTHSVERTRVLDVYAVAGDRLRMTRMEFESYGWGLPARADVRLVDGRFVARPEWSGTELYVDPGRIAGHRLHVDGRTYDLVALSDGRTVRIAVEDRSALDWLLHRAQAALPAVHLPPEVG